MTSLNSKTPQSGREHWAGRARNIEPSERLVESTVVAMHDAQAECGARWAGRAKAAASARGAGAPQDAGRSARTRHEGSLWGNTRTGGSCETGGARRGGGRVGGMQAGSVLTRRRFVALGGVCAAAAAVVAVGMPLAWRGNDGDGTVATSAAPSFGLAIAQAAEPGKSVVLQTSDASLMPLTGGSGFRCLELALNLQCTGENIDTLTFSLLNVPTQTVLGTRPYEAAERVVNLVNFAKDIDWSVPVEQRDAYSATLSDADLGDGKTLTVDLAEDPDWDGTRQTDYGPEHDVLYAAVREDDFWNQDPVMAAKKAWLDSECSSDSTNDEVQQLMAAYADAYAQVSATQQDAVAWSRKCWISSAVLAAANLEQTTLQVEAGFADGSTATRCYRIGTVDDFEDVMGGRFDALYDLHSSEVDLSYRIAPFYYFLNEYHAPSEDARLAAPLFTITDITDEKAEKDADSKEAASDK